MAQNQYIMEIIKHKDYENIFSIKGISRGKLLAILNAFSALEANEKALTTLQKEIRAVIELALINPRP